MSELPIQATINLGLVGHVDHGKTTLTKLLSGKWTDTHSEEKKRGITIKLGYTNFTIYKDGKLYSVNKDNNLKPFRKYSIVDAPGHESFMATMISGAAVMDCALLLIAANEKCPQAQTIEHLKTLEISGIENIIVIQNKIDLITKEEAIENYEDIKTFLSNTKYKDAPIVPLSAEYGANLSCLLKLIAETFLEKKRDSSSKPKMFIIRSFDINKPGDDYENIKGGVLGGTIVEGKFKIGDEIEIKPGFPVEKEGRLIYKTINAKINKIKSDKDDLEEAISGGSIAIMSSLDPIMTKTDFLVGQIAGLKGDLPEPIFELNFEINLFDKIITSNGELTVKPIIQTEPLMLIVNSLTTVGVVTKVNPKQATVKLKRPVMAFEGDRVVIFKRFESNKWRISGFGEVKL